MSEGVGCDMPAGVQARRFGVATEGLAEDRDREPSAPHPHEQRRLQVAGAESEVVAEERLERGVDRDRPLPTALGLADSEQAAIEVDVVPVEPEEHAAAKAGEGEQRNLRSLSRSRRPGKCRSHTSSRSTTASRRPSSRRSRSRGAPRFLGVRRTCARRGQTRTIRELTPRPTAPSLAASMRPTRHHASSRLPEPTLVRVRGADLMCLLTSTHARVGLQRRPDDRTDGSG